MTVFGWDTSHYDGVISLAAARQAKTEGIVLATAKLGEGGNYDDPADSTNLANFKTAGIEFLGGYYVVRTGTISSQVNHCITLADRDEPWWRTFPGWFWQVDLERWPYDDVAASTGIVFGKQLRERTGRLVVLYASHGQYGDQLTGWDGPLWNANYATSRQAPFRDLYPGDTSRGWSAYSGKVPTFLQYASSATIAGLTTCDANAFRGSLDELRALVLGDTVNWNDVLPGSENPSGYTAAQILLGANTAAWAALNEAKAVHAELVELKARPQVALSAEQLAALADLLRPIVRAELDRTRLVG